MKLKILLTITRLLAFLPFRFLMALGVPLGALLALGGRRRRVTMRNLTACFPGRSEAELLSITRGHCREFARLALESAVLWHWPLERIHGLVTSVQGQEHLDAALARGRGLIFAAPHCGSWEALPLYMTRQTEFAALYKPSEEIELDQLMAYQRGRSGSKMFAADRAGLRQAFRHLQAGKVLGILPDQQPKLGEGQFAPFFGVQALTMTLLSKMVQRTGCEVVFATCERLRDGSGYRIHILPADPEIHSEDIDTSLRALNRGVEACVLIAPEQYLWSYKRFSIRPEGEAAFY